MENNLDIEPYNKDYWYPDSHEFIRKAECSPEAYAFARSRVATSSLANDVTTGKEWNKFKIIPDEYKTVELTNGSLEYIDNDPEGKLNDALPMVFIHGFLGHAFEFKPYLDYFADKVRCISISVLGLEKHFDKPKDLNDVSIKNYMDLIVEFVTEKLKFKRIVLVGHSFGGIFSNAFCYYKEELVAGVSFNAISNISSHLGFLAYTQSSYGIMYQMCDEDWKNLPDLNDRDFQKKYQEIANKQVEDYYLDHQTSEDGKTTYFHYSIPEDPYESIVSFCYTRTFLRASFGHYLPNLFKMFTWGEKDFVADTTRVYQSVYEYNKGTRQIKTNSQFLQPIKGVDYWSASKEVKTRLFGSEEVFELKLKHIVEDNEYLHEAQIGHCHGFEDERHNVHTKRYKYLIPALEKYYLDVCLVEELKGKQQAKI
ncbi:unnamed protein product [Moneuplotes crassus]|uniref:AB hydrolase-1 domain-containing protein n=1 Tax=Euplotes crassus TaxID=5936 RepID=A0AAD1XBU2_EUPCR|nr:unnamed protein product [Moneuplotes crassus]